MNNLNGGYNGYRMSNRAVTAYEDGEKPLSKWLKKDIIYCIEEYIKDNEIDVVFDRKLLNKIPVKILKNVFLCVTSWHHTSSFCNETSFYSIDVDKVAKISNEYLIQLASRPKETSRIQEERWICSFLEWSGTRKHPKATEITEEGIIKGNWFIRANGTKKSITANGFKRIKKKLT